MQTPTTATLPIPPAIVVAVMRQAVAEHEDLCDMVPTVVEAETRLGNGRHTCDPECHTRCTRRCDDSDYVITVRYNTADHWATYGVIVGGADGPAIELWMD